jgi:hypothetical protein
MRVGYFHIALLIFTMAQATRASGMTDDSDKRLVIVESQGSHLSKKAREQLRTAIGDVVTSRGFELVPSQTLTDKLLRCELPGCLPQIAGATGAMLVLRVEAKYAKESFKLAIELWNSDEGKLLGREDRDCPICDEQDLWGSAALLVQGLLDRVVRDARSALDPPPVAVTTPASPQPTAPGLAVDQAPPAPSGAWLGYAGLGLAAAGAALLGTGLYYIASDGDPACSRCDWRNDTKKDGQRLAIGGGAALVLGAGLAVWRFWPSAPALSLGPSGLMVAGRFQ